jgi:hypothetical protein
MYILAENAVHQRETQWADLKLRNAGTRDRPRASSRRDDPNGEAG